MTDHEWESDAVPAHVIRAVRAVIGELSILIDEPEEDDVVDDVMEMLHDEVDEAVVRAAFKQVTA